MAPPPEEPASPPPEEPASPPQPHCQQLTDVDCARVLASVAFDHRRTVLATCEAIQRALAAAGLSADLVPFGSTVSGLAVEEACDVDLCATCRAHQADMAVPAAQRLAGAPHRHERRRRRAHEVGTNRDGHAKVQASLCTSQKKLREV